MTYVDLLHIYSIVRAGYVPQLFSLRLPNPDIIFELLEKSSGKALIFDSSFGSVRPRDSARTYVACDVRAEHVPSFPLSPIREGTNGDETLMIFHTSGSTSGRPKLIPCSYAWWDFNMRKAQKATAPYHPTRKDVTTWMYVIIVRLRPVVSNLCDL
jgi:acyl-coenzyme A synthetase/AMP-(fatty) acid ligase